MACVQKFAAVALSGKKEQRLLFLVGAGRGALMRRTSGSLIPHLHQIRCHAGVAALFHIFLRPTAWGFAPQTPGRGPLHDEARCHAGVAALFHTFLKLAAWGFAPQTPGRGPLHDGPLRSRVQGLCPLTPEPQQTSCERCRIPHFQKLCHALTESVGSQRHRRLICLQPGANWLRYAPPVDLQAATTRRMEG